MTQSKLNTLLLSVIVIFILGWVCYILRSVLKPFVVAVFLSILLEPLMDGLHKRKIPKGIAVLIVLILTFSILFLLGLLIYASSTSFVDEFPKYETKIVSMFQNILLWLNIPLSDLNTYIKNIDWTSAISDLSLPSYISSGIGSFFNFLGNIFLVLLFMVYALLGKEYLFSRLERAFEDKHSQQITDAVKNIDKQIQTYLIAKTLISFATGLLATLVLLAFGVDFAVVWGMITFLLNYIPNIGSIIATFPPILLALVQFDSIFKTIWVAVCLITIQMIMGNFIEPKYMGKRLQLSPLIVILFLLFWGFLWGIVGMVLAVPIAAMIKIITANIKPLRPISVLMSGN